MANSAGVIETTIVIDEETWNEFKIFVSSRYGSLRTTRLAVEKALKRVKTLETLKEFSEAMGFVNSACPSVREVEERRPKIRTSAGEEVRGLRNEREAGEDQCHVRIGVRDRLYGEFFISQGLR